jgi:hypothetical protein
MATIAAPGVPAFSTSELKAFVLTCFEICDRDTFTGSLQNALRARYSGEPRRNQSQWITVVEVVTAVLVPAYIFLLLFSDITYNSGGSVVRVGYGASVHA